MVVPGETSTGIPSMLTLNLTSSAILFQLSASAISVRPYFVTPFSCPASNVCCLMSNVSHHRLQRIGIVRQPVITGLRLLAMGDVPLKFIPEMPDGTTHGPRSRITKRTYRIALD